MQSRPKFTAHHHQHPVAGGMGHVSISAEMEGQPPLTLSVYPKFKVGSLSSTAAYLTGFAAPVVDATHHHEGEHDDDSPKAASYVIPDHLMSDPHAAYRRMQEIHASMQKGDIAFSITPNAFTRVFAQTVGTLFSSNGGSVSDVMIGHKTFDRKRIADGVKSVEVTNCAHSVCDVLGAGGLKLPTKDVGIAGYPTPSGVSKFLQGVHKTTPHQAKSMFHHATPAPTPAAAPKTAANHDMPLVDPVFKFL